jgi:hypothetical protein
MFLLLGARCKPYGPPSGARLAVASILTDRREALAEVISALIVLADTGARIIAWKLRAGVPGPGPSSACPTAGAAIGVMTSVLGAGRRRIARAVVAVLICRAGGALETGELAIFGLRVGICEDYKGARLAGQRGHADRRDQKAKSPESLPHSKPLSRSRSRPGAARNEPVDPAASSFRTSGQA